MSALITIELAQARNAELAREAERAAEVRRAIADRQEPAARRRFSGFSLNLAGALHALHV